MRKNIINNEEKKEEEKVEQNVQQNVQENSSSSGSETVTLTTETIETLETLEYNGADLTTGPAGLDPFPGQANSLGGEGPSSPSNPVLSSIRKHFFDRRGFQASDAQLNESVVGSPNSHSVGIWPAANEDFNDNGRNESGAKGPIKEDDPDYVDGKPVKGPAGPEIASSVDSEKKPKTGLMSNKKEKEKENDNDGCEMTSEIPEGSIVWKIYNKKGTPLADNRVPIINEKTKDKDLIEDLQNRLRQTEISPKADD